MAQGRVTLFAGLIATLLLALAGLWAATQFLAYVFGYQDALGAPLWRHPGFAVYSPGAALEWRSAWAELYPRPFAVAGLILLAGFGLALGALWLTWRRVAAKPRFGEKAWGDRKDAIKAGLLATGGMVLGKLDREILCFDGEGHQLLIGPSRKGKGRSHVVPTLLTWPHAALVVDLKGELAHGDPRHQFPGTAGFRSALGPTIWFAPTQKDSAKWNPLFEVRQGDHEVGDVQNLVECLIGPEAKGGDPFWDKSAATVLTGVILHVLYTEPLERRTLAVVRERLATLKTYAQQMRATLHRRNPLTGTPEVHPEILQAANKFLGDEERMQSAIRATAHAYLGIFADPIVAANTATSDFRLFDLVAGSHPMSLYLQPPPQDLGRFLPTFRFMIEMVGKTLMADQTKTAQGHLKRHPLLFVLDEFPMLGRLGFIETNMGAMAGYGLKAYLVCQSPNHIRRTYGRDNAIVDNCHLVCAFGTAEPGSAEWISSLGGKVFDTVEQVSKRRSVKPFEAEATVTFREEERALIAAKDIQTLPDADQLIFVQGHKPLRAKKLAYDKEPIFQQRLRPVMENRTGLTTAHDWVAVRALGRLETTAAGTVRVAPIDQAQGKLDLTNSERASAGFSAHSGREAHPRAPSPGAASPQGAARTAIQAAAPNRAPELVKEPGQKVTPPSPPNTSPDRALRLAATDANASQDAPLEAAAHAASNAPENTADPAQDLAIYPKPDEIAEPTSIPVTPAGGTAHANGAFGSEPSAARRPALQGPPPTTETTGRPSRRRPSLGGA
jgi:type IV secretion system protein VirD4